MLEQEATVLHPGMTLRDYFAAAAMQGLMGNSGLSFNLGNLPRPVALMESGDLMIISAAAYHVADAMLAAREGNPDD